MRPAIIPALTFTRGVAGRAEEAIAFYCSVFKDSKRGTTAYYPRGMEQNQEGTVMFADFFIDNTWLAAMDSAGDHDFTFNEAVSLLIPCDSQADIDYYWDKLSADPRAEQCGWLKDKFGLSWQVWQGHGRDDEPGNARATCSRDQGLPAHEEVRPGGAEASLRGPLIMAVGLRLVSRLAARPVLRIRPATRARPSVTSPFRRVSIAMTLETHKAPGEEVRDRGHAP